MAGWRELLRRARLSLAVALIVAAVPGPPGAAQTQGSSTSPQRGLVPQKPVYVQDSIAVRGSVPAPVIRVYKDTNAWFGENRDSATLSAIGKVLGVDWFVHPVAACQGGIPAGTAVVLFTSNGVGLSSSTAAQNHPACQAALAAFLESGGVLVVDMGDNDPVGGYRAPGAPGTPDYLFPSPGDDATLTPAAATHPVVLGADGIPGTADDLNNANIDECCFIAHGHLGAGGGVALPATATSLMTAIFGGEPRSILAEYCRGSGRVILDTITKEFFVHLPAGNGPSLFLTNLFTYALSPSAQCIQQVKLDIKPNSNVNPIDLKSNGVITVAILTTATFDARTVNPTTVCFGDNPPNPIDSDCTEAHGKGHLEDVDGDGDLDLVLHFETQETRIDAGDTQACLTAATFGGIRVRGCDSVQTV
jgi:hypothetical protein